MIDLGCAEHGHRPFGQREAREGKQKLIDFWIPVIGALGEARTVYPSLVSGRSVSFRLRFRFVRVVRALRAGEAKLRGRMTRDVLIAGPAG